MAMARSVVCIPEGLLCRGAGPGSHPQCTLHPCGQAVAPICCSLRTADYREHASETKLGCSTAPALRSVAKRHDASLHLHMEFGPIRPAGRIVYVGAALPVRIVYASIRHCSAPEVPSSDLASATFAWLHCNAVIACSGWISPVQLLRALMFLN